MDNAALKYDMSLVGRRCTAFVSPEEDDDAFEEGYYAATVVAFNNRCAAHKGYYARSTFVTHFRTACYYSHISYLSGRFLLHFDDGLRERADFPDDSVRIMSTRVSKCRCLHSPGGAVGWCAGVDGSEPLPRPWEANPM